MGCRSPRRGRRTGPGRSGIDRVAPGAAVDSDERIGAISRLACVYSIDHAVEVPWAAAPPLDAGRSAPHADVTLVDMQEHGRVDAERLPSCRRVREVLQRTRGRARERARAPDDWT